MNNGIHHSIAALAFGILISTAGAAELPKLSEEQSAAAAANYQQYCALCHGDEREGYANDHAPSLRSQSLLTSGQQEMFWTTAYGRRGTPMAGYIDDIGGPMDLVEVYNLTVWLRSQAEIEPYEFTAEPVVGDVDAGREIYANACASCHGAEGEGGTGTALGNPAMLSLTTDRFLRYAIEHGREGTEMRAFGETLSADGIDAVTAFLRSRATGWTNEKPVYRAPPEADDYVLNSGAPAPAFELKNGLYVSSADLLQALREKRRMVLLDTRAMSMWQMVHIEGSVPLPYYYENVAALAEDLPRDGTMIVTYCECPRAAAESVNKKLRELGFENTAVLWEGIGGWIALGYPVSRGETAAIERLARPPEG